MGLPQPIVVPDFGVRTRTAFDLEKKLVAFVTQLVTDSFKLDNPAVNFQQPDEVPYNPIGRALTLTGKEPPQVKRGRIARTVTGEIDADKAPDFPAIIVQAMSGKVETEVTIITVQMLVNAYDEDPQSEGYQDVLNMIEAVVPLLTSVGQGGLADSYVIQLPMEWKIYPENAFPHFFGEITSMWQLPSGRPMPDVDATLAPGESLTVLSESL